MMSCPYSDEELQKWDGVSNPMGPECSRCYNCECEHWAGDCFECDRSPCIDPMRRAEQEIYYENLP